MIYRPFPVLCGMRLARTLAHCGARCGLPIVRPVAESSAFGRASLIIGFQLFKTLGRLRACTQRYGGCAWEIFGSAGFLWPVLHTRAQLPPSFCVQAD
ncbi:MAG TPA: hypothetical protein DIT33_01140 [Pseudomonas sp.]|nr:hypothetical protein [Pseudomonas sp.]